jgi:predicted phage terminase large subunit-like protein
LNAAAARVSPALLARYLDPSFRVPPHVQLMSREIRKAVTAGSGRLIISMPPRHGKSWMCSYWTPAWVLEVWPEWDVIMAGYGAAYATEWGRRVRNTLLDNEDRLLVKVADDSAAADQWNTREGGSMRTVGVGGPLRGRGAHVLIVDDPIKDAEEARSEVMRQKLWEWWTETAGSRLEPEGTLIVVMTRSHEDDMVGRLLAAEDAGNWTHLCFPAIAEEADVLGREPGDPLWPGRFDAEALAEIRTRVGSYAFAGEYQQRPAPAGGAIFLRRNFRYLTLQGDYYILHDPERGNRRIARSSCWRAQVADTALKDKTTSDYTVVLTFAVTQTGELLVLDVARDRLEVPQQLAYLRAQQRKWGPRWLGVEDKASGTGLLQTARQGGHPFRPLAAVTDKIDRAQPAATLCENGAIYFLRDAPWLNDFEAELLVFPNGTYDDQVDTLGYAVREMTTSVSLLRGDGDQYTKARSVLDGFAPEKGVRW